MTEKNIVNMKVCLLGQTSVGKSSLVLRFIQNAFFANTEGTIGAAYLTKTLDLDNETQIKFEIWDTAGQERYHSLAPMYYRGAHAALIVYDVTSRDSFDKVRTWVSELREKGTPDQIIVVVGNKTDLPRKMVDTEEAQKYANENGLLFMETSAKEGTNVEEVFRAIANKMPKSLLQPPSTAKVNLANNNGGKSGCPC